MLREKTNDFEVLKKPETATLVTLMGLSFNSFAASTGNGTLVRCKKMTSVEPSNNLIQVDLYTTNGINSAKTDTASANLDPEIPVRMDLFL